MANMGDTGGKPDRNLADTFWASMLDLLRYLAGATDTPEVRTIAAETFGRRTYETRTGLVKPTTVSMKRTPRQHKPWEASRR